MTRRVPSAFSRVRPARFRGPRRFASNPFVSATAYRRSSRSSPPVGEQNNARNNNTNRRGPPGFHPTPSRVRRTRPALFHTHPPTSTPPLAGRHARIMYIYIYVHVRVYDAHARVYYTRLDRRRMRVQIKNSGEISARRPLIRRGLLLRRQK